MKIRKRNERIADFDTNEIITVLDKTFVDFPELTEEEISNLKENIISNITMEAEKQQDKDNLFDVEDCQDIIVSSLRKSGYRKIANSFQRYREDRAVDRQLRKVFEVVSNEDTDEKTENANVDGYTMSGRHLHISEDVLKIHSAKHVYSKKVMKAIDDGIIYAHDRGWSSIGSLTCNQIDLKILFKDGFNTGHGFLREPGGIKTAFMLSAIAIQSSQNDYHGGQSIPQFDYSLAPYVTKSFRKYICKHLEAVNVYLNLQIPNIQDITALIKNPGFITDFNYDLAYDKLSNAYSFDQWANIIKLAMKDTEDEAYQGAEGLIHNLNTMHSRAGAQVPFSSINFGMDTSESGRLVAKSLLQAQMSGLGHHETPIFPILIYTLKKGVNFNKEDKNYDIFRLAMQCSSERLFPTYSFVDSSFNLPFYERDPYYGCIQTMGCRTRVMANVNGREGAIGRGNLSFNSINLPMLALNADGNINKFYKELDKALDLNYQALMERYKVQAQQQKRNLPFMVGCNMWLDADKLTSDFDSIEPLLKHGTLSIGFVGLAECLVCLIGKHHGESEEADKLGYEIVSYIKDYCDQKTEETHLNFTCLGTPAETYCYTALKQCRGKYGIIPGVTDRDYLTNSSHVPVYYPITISEKARIEGKYHKLENAGHIFYCEVDGDISKNIDAFEQILHTMADADVGYGAVNIPIIYCPECYKSFRGSDDVHVCPYCGYCELEESSTSDIISCDCE